MVIVGMAAAFACSLSAFAAPVNVSIQIVPNAEIINQSDLSFRFTAYSNVEGIIHWQERLSNSPDRWVTFSSVSGNVIYYTFGSSGSAARAEYIDIRAYIEYDGITYYSNESRIYNSSNMEIPEIITFSEFGNQVLDFLVSSFNIVLPWFIEHPIVFVGLALSLIIAAIGTLRHIVGGSHEEKISYDIDCSY